MTARTKMRYCALEYRRTLTDPWFDGNYNGRIYFALEWLCYAKIWRAAARQGMW